MRLLTVLLSIFFAIFAAILARNITFYKSLLDSFVKQPIPPSYQYRNASAMTSPAPRKVAFSFLAREQAEGQGARVRRSIGTPRLKNFTPFLMLDHFSVDKNAGFPDHPHRGQETVTYLLEGNVDHEDFAGNKGTIGPGDLQFMTAGRGIVHAEMPRHEDDSKPVVGMQLWIDLPKALKFVEPRYRDLRAAEIPRIELDEGKVSVNIISGESHGTESVQELAYTPVWLLDFTVQPGGRVSQALPRSWNAFVYTLKGTTRFEGVEVGQYHNAVFEQEGDVVRAEVDADATEPGRFILVAGQPLEQSIFQYGPFVLNTREQVMQALMDYQSYQNGFERAEGFQSEIGKRIAQH